MSEKVLILTVAYNRPDFIPYQYKCFQKFLTEPFEYVVYNNADNEKSSSGIRETCDSIGIQCFRVPQSIHKSGDPSVRCAESLNYAIASHVVHHQGVVCIIDSDMFLVKPFSISEQLSKHDIAAIPQVRDDVHYITNQLIFMKGLPNLNNFKMDCVRVGNTNTDTGGYFYYYHKQNPEIKFQSITHIPSGYPKREYLSTVENEKVREYMRNDPSPEEPGAFAELYLNHTFLHYRAGSNWIGKSREEMERRNGYLYTLMDNLLG